MHEDAHNIPVMLGSLKHGKNCSTALKIQFQGKEKYTTIGLESVIDHNPWVWNVVFGIPDMLKSASFESDFLFESVTNRHHEELDFDLLFDGQTLSKLF